jgi:hypothetical protein
MASTCSGEDSLHEKITPTPKILAWHVPSNQVTGPFAETTHQHAGTVLASISIGVHIAAWLLLAKSMFAK